jgi:hypothetical protein
MFEALHAHLSGLASPPPRRNPKAAVAESAAAVAESAASRCRGRPQAAAAATDAAAAATEAAAAARVPGTAGGLSRSEPLKPAPWRPVDRTPWYETGQTD